jgi:16S rRNA G527 N7-methylase RsmG
MKQDSSLRDAYLKLIASWNKTHNLIGKHSAELLYKESLQALSTCEEIREYECLVDIGAGSGIMGMPWVLSEGSRKRAIFIEPDKKSASFLLLMKASLPPIANKILILDSRLENVRRETLKDFSSSFFCVSRAFSPSEKLNDLYLSSELRDDPLFVYFKSSGASKDQISGLKKIIEGNK